MLVQLPSKSFLPQSPLLGRQMKSDVVWEKSALFCFNTMHFSLLDLKIFCHTASTLRRSFTSHYGRYLLNKYLSNEWITFKSLQKRGVTHSPHSSGGFTENSLEIGCVILYTPYSAQSLCASTHVHTTTTLDSQTTYLPMECLKAMYVCTYVTF